MALVKIVNYEGGSDARYDVNAATPEERRLLDSEGRPLANNLPDQWTWTPGLPGARGGSGPGDLGGGGDSSSVFGNPYFQQFQAANQAQQTADLSDTKSQIQQILIQLGLIPGNYVDKLGALDDTIRQLIEQNTQSGISQYARMLEAKSDVQRETVGNLAARGLSRSGAKGHRLRRNQLNFDRNFSDALTAVLSNIGQLQSGYANREFGRQMNLSQFLASLMSSWRPSTSSFSVPQVQQQAQPAYSAPSLPGPTGTTQIGGTTYNYYRPPTSGGGGRFLVD